MTKSKKERPPHPVHLLVREEGQLARIGCGQAVSSPSQYTDRVLKASCYACAKMAPGLSDGARTEIYDNAQDRCGRDGKSPWQRAKERAARKESAAEKQKAKEARKAARAAKRAA
jgi:hypothetical protein